ncbi:MAG: DNA polymerase III subunit delta [Rhodospirillales bacterium]
MKITGRQTDSFLDNPGEDVAAVLIYGPDHGLVRERADRLIRAVAGAGDDPFRVASLTESDIADDAERLASERAALAFGGGRRAIRIDGGDKLAPAVERALDVAGDGVVVIVGGELPARSKLRKLCEGAKTAAAVPCYADDTRATEQVVREALTAANLTIGREALAYLSENLGNDRLVSRRELEKLVLYMADAGPEVTLADAQACVGDNAGRGTDAVTRALAGGDVPALLRDYASALDLGDGAIGMLRAAQRMFQRLHLAAGDVARGSRPEQAVENLRPPVFFKEKPLFINALRSWPPARLGTALEILTEAERACKSGLGPDEVICERAFIRLARLAR